MNKFKYLIFSVLFLSVLSCEDFRLGNASLEKPTGSQMNIDTIFSSKIYADQALTHAYTKLPSIHDNDLNEYGIQESLTDLNQDYQRFGSFKKIYYPGQLKADVAPKMTRYNFIDAWESIRSAYTFIQNVDRVPDMSDELKTARKAEAYTIIALHYTELFRNFGGLPWIDHAYSTEELGQDINLPRLTVEQTVNNICSILDNVIATDVFPWEWPNLEDDGRMTKAAALAIKIRLLHFAASPLFNSDAHFYPGSSDLCTWYGNYDKSRWQDVLDAINQFETLNAAAGNTYKLYQDSDPRLAFRNAYMLRRNGEVVISTRKTAKYSPSEFWFFKGQGQGLLCSTLDYVDMFPMLDGSDFSWDNPDHQKSPFFTDGGKWHSNPHDPSLQPRRDPRLYETVNINNDVYQSRCVENYVGGKEKKNADRTFGQSASGFCFRKFRLDRDPGHNAHFWSWPYFRMAEFYLIKAEVLNELNKTAEAYPYVDMIRDRVQMPHIQSGLNQEGMRAAILRERALELGYEEIRLHDMVRCKLEDDFKKELHGLETKRDKATMALTYERYVIPIKRAWQGDGWDPKMYLNPIPLDEVNKKYGLTQNPGW